MDKKAKSSILEENKFLDNLNYQKQAELITLGLKNTVSSPINKKNSKDFKGEIPNAFIQHKLESDPYYSLNPQASSDQVETVGGNPEEASPRDTESENVKPEEILSEDHEISLGELDGGDADAEPEKILSQSNETTLESLDTSLPEDAVDSPELPNDQDEPDQVLQSNIDPTLPSETDIAEESGSISQLKGKDPFMDLDERLNIKDEFDFDQEPITEEVGEAEDEQNLDLLDTVLAQSNSDEGDPVSYQDSEVPQDEFLEKPETEDKPPPAIFDEEDQGLTSGETYQDSEVPQDDLLEKPQTEDKPPPAISDEENQVLTSGEIDDERVDGVDSQDDELDEEVFYEDYQNKLRKATDKKFNKQKFEEKLLGYYPENRKLIQSFLDSQDYNDEEKERLIENILSDKNEEIIVEGLTQKMLNKTGYEVWERRGKSQLREKQVFDRTLNRYLRRRNFRLFLIYSVISLLVIFSIFTAYQIYYPIHLYKQSVIAIQENRFLEGESLFNQAYSKRADIEYTQTLGMIYAQKSRLKEADEKFNLLLRDFPDDLDSLLANVAFNRKLKRFDTAKELLSKTKRLFPQNTEQMNEEVDLLIDHGQSHKDFDTAVKFWGQAEKMVSDLSILDPDHESEYLQKKIALSALKQEYQQAKNYFNLLNQEQHPYELNSMSVYLDYLISIQEEQIVRTHLLLEGKSSEAEGIYIIASIDRLFRDLTANYPDHYSLDLFQARWQNIAKRPKLAIQQALKGLESIENQQNYFLNDDLVEALNLLGRLYVQNQEMVLAQETFQKSLEVQFKDPTANYYLGKINFLHLNLPQTAYPQLKTAYQEWRDTRAVNKIQYADTLYTLGYIEFQNGKNIANASSFETRKVRENHFKESVYYWSELAKLNLKEKSYLIDFSIGTGYLHLQEYGMAKIFYQNELDELEPIVKFIDNKSDLFVQETGFRRNELRILSDIYNNMAVAQLGENGRDPIIPNDVSGEAIEYFISSIILKDKIGDLKGVPYANFNTLNDYPKRLLNYIRNRPFRIADASIPKSILPMTF